MKKQLDDASASLKDNIIEILPVNEGRTLEFNLSSLFCHIAAKL